LLLAIFKVALATAISARPKLRTCYEMADTRRSDRQGLPVPPLIPLNDYG
jgi:hypothetical protein